MDKRALAERNHQLTQALHQPTPKQAARRALLTGIGKLPITQQSGGQNRLLILRPDHLGDVLLTLPAIKALRRAMPTTEIHALVGEWSADVLAPIADIDQVLTLSFPGFNRQANDQPSPYLLAIRTAHMLRQIGYDSVLVMRPDHWWGALLAFLAGIPQRVGFDLPETHPFLTHMIAEQTHQHVVTQSMMIVNTALNKSLDTPLYEFPVEQEARLAMRARLEEQGVAAESPYIVVHVGSGAVVKNWEIEKWARVADALADGMTASIILTGTQQERPTAVQIASAMKHPPVITNGETSLAQLAALLSEASLVLGCDSGPMHLAAAVGAPTVTLFGPAAPILFRPWGDPETHPVVTSDIGCLHCRILDWSGDDLAHHPCVRDITTAQVIDAAWRALNASANRGSRSL